MDVVYLKCKKAFDTVFHKILIKELIKYKLDKQRVKWTENWLTARLKGLLSVSQSPAGDQCLEVYPRGW